MKNYSPEDIWNTDETGLFFRALPNKTLCLKSDPCKGGKISKERLTVMFCVNMVGDREKPLVIGKYAKPRCFNGMNPENFNIIWKSNKRAWMTREIMTEWLHQLDRKMKRRNRKILLFLDNATSHPDITLENVKLVFFPANCTSVIQPLD